jgi:HAMP domain-containing protein
MAVAQQEDEILQRGRALALSGAAGYAAVLQKGLDSKALTWDDLVHPSYTEIHFTVPVAEPRYHASFDWYTDASGIQSFEDAMTSSDSMLLYAVGNDLTGYIPTTLKGFSAEPTGDPVKDAVNARSKRRFESPMHKAAAAWVGNEPLIQEYHRDTGHVAWDVAAPIWIRNSFNKELFHWGSFRVGMRQERIAEVRNAVILRLGVVFAAFELLLASIMYFAVRRQMRPLHRLAGEAVAVSLGEREDKVAARPGDAAEIREMASAVGRLQVSLREAMRRLDTTGSKAIPAAVDPAATHPYKMMEVVR